MSEEEKKAIEYLKNMYWYADEDEEERFVNIVLNLIQRLQKENKYIHSELDKQQEKINNYAKQIEKKDKIIDLMAEYINELDIDEDICSKNIINPDICNEQYSNCKACVKQYFERKVENER